MTGVATEWERPDAFYPEADWPEIYAFSSPLPHDSPGVRLNLSLSQGRLIGIGYWNDDPEGHAYADNDPYLNPGSSDQEIGLHVFQAQTYVAPHTITGVIYGVTQDYGQALTSNNAFYWPAGLPAIVNGKLEYHFSLDIRLTVGPGTFRIYEWLPQYLSTPYPVDVQFPFFPCPPLARPPWPYIEGALDFGNTQTGVRRH